MKTPTGSVVEGDRSGFPMPRFSFEDRPEWLDRRGVSRDRDPELTQTVRAIIDDVRLRGDASLCELTERFDGVALKELRVPDAEIEKAYQAVDVSFLEALRDSIRAVREFHIAQRIVSNAVETAPGVKAWRVWRPIWRVGLYVPGGKARYPSSVVMLGVAAEVAGCPERVLVTPPGSDGRVPAQTLVAASEVGVTEIYRIGGAQAVAALAYGTESIRPVEKIFGPGNSYVTEAKLAVFPDVAVDLPAGPSELMIIADETAPPAWVAADMLGNAEHAPDSPVILVVDSARLADAVMAEIETQLTTLPRGTIAQEAFFEFGSCIVASSIEDGVAIANSYAPEHLQLMVRNPRAVLEKISNAGSVFIGPHAPNSAGDYATGTNHVLPTGGHARAFQGLSVEAFGRVMQVQDIDPDGIERMAPVVATLARAEGLEGHARAAEIRLRSTAI